jgi:hypothetical protein
MTVDLQELANGDLFTDATVVCANELHKALAWLEAKMKGMTLDRCQAHGLFIAHTVLLTDLKRAQEQLARQSAPWFEIDQGWDRWWGWDPYAYECLADALRDHPEGAAGWVTVRGMPDPVWLGPDVHEKTVGLCQDGTIVFDLEDDDPGEEVSLGDQVARELDESDLLAAGGAPCP